VWRDIDGDDYYNCPIRFIPDSVYAWYEEYSYYKSFESAPGAYHEMTAKWLEAMHVYQSYLSKYTEEIQETKARKSNGLGALRQGKHGK